MRHWLLKSEPDCYSIADLKRDGEVSWDGVRNYQARNTLRDEMQDGDLCLFYHSSADPTAAVGIAEVRGKSHPDKTQFDSKADHYDPDSDPANPRWFAVTVAYKETFAHPVTIAQMRAEPSLASMALLRPGQRLSVLPVTPEEFATVVQLSKKG